jgi:ATP phosphoribosyltransferase regulatory subunit
MLGLRADTTPQVARIDAHLLNRAGVTRLCYCGPVLHTRPDRPYATREPLQFGAEIYGHAGLEADLEILSLALDSLASAQVSGLSVDLADASIVRSLLAGVQVDPPVVAQVHAALATKDSSELAAVTRHFPGPTRESLLALVQLYGDAGVLDEARRALKSAPGIDQALANLQWLAQQLGDTQVTFDLADLRGYAYYSGARFAVYAKGAGDAVVRGGRYDGVGAVFGHNLDRARPAVGFSLDLKALVTAAAPRPLKAAIRSPWGQGAALRAAIAGLRSRGETVVCVMPGHESEIDEFHCDRELIEAAGQWVVQAI